MAGHIQKKIRRYCIIALLSAAVVEMSILLSMVVHWRNSRTDLVAPREQELCLPCDRFMSTQFDNLGLIQNFDSIRNLTNCCGKGSAVFSKLDEENIAKRYDSNTNPEFSYMNLTGFGCKTMTKTPPTAKLMGLAESKMPVSAGGTSSKIFWKSSYVTPGLVYSSDDGTIYVEAQGFYFISSQIKLRIEGKSETKSSTEGVIRHSLFLISKKEGREKVLLENARSLCEMATDVSSLTSVVGAVFKLETSDRIYVTTTHPEHLEHDPLNNFLIMYAL